MEEKNNLNIRLSHLQNQLNEIKIYIILKQISFM